MTRWFRMYDEILDDPKVQKLPPEDFKAWVNLLCLASKNDGKLPSTTDIAFALRVTEDAVTTLLDRLLSAGLIDVRSGGANGSHHAPHGWQKRQYKSDTSVERVKRYRERHRNATETADETPPEPEPETETEQSPQTPADGGSGLGHDPAILAKELCGLVGIRKAGPAATRHVGLWLGEGIAPATIRNAMAAFAPKMRAPPQSLKSFDRAVRIEHAERPAKALNGHAKRYEPQTEDELNRAISLAEDRGWTGDAEKYRRQLAELVGRTAAKLRTPDAARHH